MRTIKLSPDQIITLNDYPLHNDKVLSEYYTKCTKGLELPYVPVIKKGVVVKCFDDNLLEVFKQYEQKNPAAEYFMLDGSHRTTALTLAGRKVSAVIYETDIDIEEAKGLVETGKILGNGTLNHTLEENCRILCRHFNKKQYFMTVREKTKKMAQENKLPHSVTNPPSLVAY